MTLNPIEFLARRASDLYMRLAPQYGLPVSSTSYLNAFRHAYSAGMIAFWGGSRRAIFLGNQQERRRWYADAYIDFNRPVLDTVDTSIDLWNNHSGILQMERFRQSNFAFGEGGENFGRAVIQGLLPQNGTYIFNDTDSRIRARFKSILMS